MEGLSWSSSPSPAALVSRPSAASSGSSSAGSLGSSSGSQPLNRRTGSERGWGKGLGQQCSRIGCVLQRASRIIEEPGRHSAAAPRLRRRAAELHVGGVRGAGGRVAADVLRAQAGGLLRDGLPEGRGAAPKGALLLDLDVRGADPPLQRRWGMHTSVRRCGGAPLHAAARGRRGTITKVSPATCFVPGVPSRNKHSRATGQTALLDLTPGNRAL